MQPHVKIYFKYFSYGEQDFIPCEACGTRANDIHHIQGRGPGKNIIRNLMALCRRHHDMAKAEVVKPDKFQEIHDKFLNGEREIFLL